MSMIDDIKRDRKAGTKGPWAWRVNDGPQWFLAPGVLIAEGGMTDGTPGGDKHDRANARRIARVPDMEAALIEAMEALQALVSANNSTDGMAMRKAWDKARAAIARAIPAPTETRVQCYRGEYYKAKEHGTCIKNADGSINWASWKDAE